MIANRFQFDMIGLDLVHPNQFGGVRQRSTEDAGVYLTHLVRAGWARGHKTSVLAFDIAQFFPSLNHEFLLAVMKKLGFPPLVVKFFESYLVERFTAYCWNRFKSEPLQADVGVGQGSALSPVLSALYIAPLMQLYELESPHLDTTLISYVDDGTVVTQSTNLDTNNVILKVAYAILFRLFTASGLALEHNKTELFHFTRERSDNGLPSLDLGYAPFTGETPLTPKLYWRYLGFYFDRKLTFQEHVRFYSTKALTTVKAMGMLGNSARGLPSKERRLLYRSCVVPIATYGFRMWYYNGSKIAGVMKLLNQMQRRAALWITGAFKTSPAGGVQAIAGLIPIHLHIRKLAWRAMYRTATLSDTHPTRSLLGLEYRKEAVEHPLALNRLRRKERSKVKGGIPDIQADLPGLTESFAPCAPEARPGYRLLDLFPQCITFADRRDIVLPEEEEEPDFGGNVAAQQRWIWLHVQNPLWRHLNGIRDQAFTEPNTIVAGTDASVPKSARHQAVAACVLYQAGVLVHKSRYVSGKLEIDNPNALRMELAALSGVMSNVPWLKLSIPFGFAAPPAPSPASTAAPLPVVPVSPETPAAGGARMDTGPEGVQAPEEPAAPTADPPAPKDKGKRKAPPIARPQAKKPAIAHQPPPKVPLATKPRKSYARMTASNHRHVPFRAISQDPVALATLAQSLPNTPAKKIVQISQQAAAPPPPSPRRRRRIYSTLRPVPSGRNSCSNSRARTTRPLTVTVWSSRSIIIWMLSALSAPSFPAQLRTAATPSRPTRSSPRASSTSFVGSWCLTSSTDSQRSGWVCPNPRPTSRS